MSHVWLIGMMASGKSTVGDLAAARLGRPFYDTDDLVESDAHMSIADIFEQCGEAEFRARERKAVAGIALESAGIVATGGGVVLDPVNVATMRASGVVVLLSVDPDVLASRVVDGGERPLLSGGADEGIRAIARERDRMYRAAADTTIDASGTVLEVSEQVEAVCRGL